MSLQRRIERLEQQHEERATVDAAKSMSVRRLIVNGRPFGRFAVAIDAVPEIGLAEVAAEPGESVAALVDRVAPLIQWPEGQRVMVTINVRSKDEL